MILNEHILNEHIKVADVFYQRLLDRLKNRRYAEISQADYYLFNTMTYRLAPDKLPNSFYDLRDWLYTRIAKDEVYSNTGYRQEHFCIGVLFGTCMFVDEIWREIWPEDKRSFAKYYIRIRKEQLTNSSGEQNDD